MTTYRQRARLARATTLIVRKGERLVHAAVGAGYSDQAHMSRHMRRDLGFSPGAVARILRG